jgi:predicted DNA-binding ribbon-helix-helix protein
MKTTILSVRLNDYMRDKLKKIAQDNDLAESELVRVLVDKLIEGKIQLTNQLVFDTVNIDGLKKQADVRGVPVQRLVDAVVEQLDESRRNQRE